MRLRPPALVFLVLGLVSLGACRSTPASGDAKSSSTKPKAEKVAEKPEDNDQPKKPFHWPWQKKDKEDQAAPKDDAKKDGNSEQIDEPLPSDDGGPGPAEAEPVKEKKKGWFSGLRWPWQKKPAADGQPPHAEPDLHPAEALPPPPRPTPDQIQPRVPEPGLSPPDSPAPREPKEKDPLSGVGLHPGS